MQKGSSHPSPTSAIRCSAALTAEEMSATAWARAVRMAGTAGTGCRRARARAAAATLAGSLRFCRSRSTLSRLSMSKSYRAYSRSEGSLDGDCTEIGPRGDMHSTADGEA